MPNVFEPDFEPEDVDREGFAHRGAWIGHRAGAEHLGASLYEVAPGQANCPYHWHAANEEMLIVLRGSIALRGPNGWRDVGEGEVVAFPRGERGAHQIVNRSEETVRFLVISEMRHPEVIVYPDSSKIGARHGAPGSDERVALNFRAGDGVDYWEGEEPPRPG